MSWALAPELVQASPPSLAVPPAPLCSAVAGVGPSEVSRARWACPRFLRTPGERRVYAPPAGSLPDELAVAPAPPPSCCCSSCPRSFLPTLRRLGSAGPAPPGAQGVEPRCPKTPPSSPLRVVLLVLLVPVVLPALGCLALVPRSYALPTLPRVGWVVRVLTPGLVLPAIVLVPLLAVLLPGLLLPAPVLVLFGGFPPVPRPPAIPVFFFVPVAGRVEEGRFHPRSQASGNLSPGLRPGCLGSTLALGGVVRAQSLRPRAVDTPCRAGRPAANHENLEEELAGLPAGSCWPCAQQSSATMRMPKTGLLPTGTYWGSAADAPFLEAFKGLRCAVVKRLYKNTKG